MVAVSKEFHWQAVSVHQAHTWVLLHYITEDTYNTVCVSVHHFQSTRPFFLTLIQFMSTRSFHERTF